jgi:cathepsin D
MILSSTPPLVVAILLSLTLDASAIPQADNSRPGGLTIPLRKRAPAARTPEEWGIWAKKHREGLEAKYGNSKHEKRSKGTNLYVFLFQPTLYANMIVKTLG